MRNLYLTLFIGIFIFASCRREKAYWDTQMKGPIVNSSLSINDILQSDNIVENPDSSLKMVIQEPLTRLTIDSLFDFRDTVVTFGASLQSLELDNISIRESVTLEEMAANDPGASFAINLFHGSTVQTPAFSVDQPIENSISNSEYFESLTVETAKIRFTFENNLPIDIEDVVFELKNDPIHGGDIIYRDTFPSIPASSVVMDSAIISNKIIKSDLIGTLIQMEVLESDGPVPVNKFDSLVATIEVLDVNPIEATAIWPAQDLIDSNSVVNLEADQTFKIFDMLAKEGEVILEAFSSLEDTLYITYTLPNIIRDTITMDPFVIDTFIPPAVNGVFGRVEKNFSVDGYYYLLNGYGIESYDLRPIDYNGNGIEDSDTINTFVQNMKGRIQYTGQMKTLKRSDTLYIRAGMINVVPEYVRGYVEEQSFSFGPSVTSFDIFNKIRSGSIDLEDVDMDISLNNGLGVPAEVNLNQIKGINSRNNQEVTLSGTPIASAINFSPAQRTFNVNAPVSITNTNVALNPSNSNVDAFAENLPNSIEYQVDFTLNPGIGDLTAAEIAGNPPNFIYYDYGLEANLDLEIPLSFMADSLVLVDTLNYNYNTTTDAYNDGNFSLIANNDFPFDALVELIIVDQNGIFIDSLINDGFIERAPIQSGNNRISESKVSLITFSISKERLQNLIDGAKIIARVGFHTNSLPSATNDHVKIFSDYKIKLTLTGDVNIQLSR
jgi:hypothetical protein